MPTLTERGGRMLLHLREAEAGLTEAELAFRAAEPIGEEGDGLIRKEGERWRLDQERLPQVERWLAAELPALGQEGRLFFSYGRTLDPEVMVSRAPAARYLCRARLPGHMLAFPRRSRRTGEFTGGAVPVPEGEGLWGVLHLVDEASLRVLDSEGGVPRAYTREALAVEVALGGERLAVRAWVLMAVEDGSGGGPPRWSYLQRVIRGARAYDLPAHYVEVLEGTEWVEDASNAEAGGSGSKYLPLVSYLEAQDGTEVRLSFGEIEKVLGFALPPSAKEHVAYWYPSDTHTTANLLAEHGWRATPQMRGGAVVFRRRWGEAPLLRLVGERLAEEDATVFRRLYDWAKAHGKCKPGEGKTPGFTFHPKSFQHSVFSVHANGDVTVHLGWLVRSVPMERVEALRVELAALPGVRGMEKPVNPGDDEHRGIGLADLRETGVQEAFLAAMGRFCGS